MEGIFACGNVLHVHDLVDFVSEEAEITGRAAADYLLGKVKKGKEIKVINGDNVAYVVPQKLIGSACDVKLFFRVKSVLNNASIVLSCDGQDVMRLKRPVLTPGEMQTVMLKKDIIAKFTGNLELKVVN